MESTSKSKSRLYQSPYIWIALVIAGLGIALFVVLRPEQSSTREDAASDPTSTGQKGRGFLGDLLDFGGAPSGSDSASGEPSSADASGPAAGGAADPTRAITADIDLVEMRRELPDNLYWKYAAPTQDPVELEERAREKARRNDAYGKVLSNTATESEIRAYYEDKKRQSEHYVKFLKHLLAKYKDELSVRDTGLIGLGIELHSARAAEVPREIQDALRRRAEYKAKKEAWLAGQR